MKTGAKRFSPGRRAFLEAGGAIVVSFSLHGFAIAQEGAKPAGPKLPSSSFNKSPALDAWIRIAADGSITVFTGKAELGQGVATALRQVAAEQLGVPFPAIRLITADTARTPDEGYTAGSNSLKDSGSAIMHAAAQVREILVAEGAKRLGARVENVKAVDGYVVAPDGKRIAYGGIASALDVRVDVQPTSKLVDPQQYKVVGKEVGRVDIPGKVTGAVAYVHDLRLPGMLHARVIRPPSIASTLESIDLARIRGLPGVVKIVRDGRYLAVICDDEFRAIQAMRALGDSAKWDVPRSLPAPATIHQRLLESPMKDFVIQEAGNVSTASGRAFEATFRRAYQIHGSIGPSCAVAQLKDGVLTIWSHSQGVFPLREAVAELVSMPRDKIRIVHMEGAGCYGHNGADDVAADAALCALAADGKPVRVQWMREQEHAWEPFGPAMVTKIRATLDQGRVNGWQLDVYSNTHSMRPGKAGHLLPGQLIARSFVPPPPQPIPQPDGGGDRNAIPLYAFPNSRVVHHFIEEMPLRVSALRALGAYANVFAIESVVEELARAAKVDPVDFRIAHLADPRAHEVIRMAADRFGWATWDRKRVQGSAAKRGRGFAFARYKNHAAYAAIALEVSVDRETGDVRVGRVVAAIDSGTAVNPDGIRNQTEGGIVQSLSWSLFEEVTWDERTVTSRDWGRYPIVRFDHVPASVEVHVIDRPGMPFLGTGEAFQGPTAGALGNAIADAIGVPLRELPMTAARVRSAAQANPRSPT